MSSARVVGDVEVGIKGLALASNLIFANHKNNRVIFWDTTLR